MYNKEDAEKIKEVVNKSKTPLLIESSVYYINEYQALKYYYASEEMKSEHIKKMAEDIYCHYVDGALYETLYNNLFEEGSAIRVLVGVFHKEMKPFFKD